MDDMRDAIAAAGLTPPDNIVMDGAIHRFSTNGKPGDDAGWYVAFDDGIQAGAFGCWRSGECGTWRAVPDQQLSPENRKEQRRRIREARQKAEADRKQKQADAATKAAEIWESAELAADHPYLSAKGIQPHGTRVMGGRLVIPMRDGGELHSLQFIDADGGKLFLPGGRTKGCYYPIGKPDGTLCIAEGFATAASIREATGYAVAVAFNAGNLEPVAKSLRQRMPDVRIVICSDNDESGTGQTKAGEAAKAVKGVVAIPPEVGDYNDLVRAHGSDAVRQSIRAATHQMPHSVMSRRMSNIVAKPVEWLWPGRVPKGKCTLIAGDPKLGKSQITASMAAVTTTGGLWPLDRTRAEVGNVIFLSAEDDPADTIKPRLQAAGADVGRIWVVEAVRDDDTERPFSLLRDVPRLGELIRHIGDVALVVIDPISAYLGGTDTHKNSDVRAALAPLGKLAADNGAAFVCVSHFNKGNIGGAMHRVTGSLAFTAAARSIYICNKDPDDESRNLFLPAGNNLACDTHGLAFHIESTAAEGIDTSRISWHAEPVTMTADQVMVTAADEERSARRDAGEWLHALLSDVTEMTKQEIMTLGKKEGFSQRTIHRARSDLGVVTRSRGFGKEKQGYWSLPANRATPRGDPVGTNGTDDESRASTTFQDVDDDQSCQSCQPTDTGTTGTTGGAERI